MHRRCDHFCLAGRSLEIWKEDLESTLQPRPSFTRFPLLSKSQGPSQGEEIFQQARIDRSGRGLSRAEAKGVLPVWHPAPTASLERLGAIMLKKHHISFIATFP